MRTKPLKRRLNDWLTIPIALLLILMGLSRVALLLVGRSAVAQVTGHKQEYIIHSDRSTADSRRYDVSYQFIADGKLYSGHARRLFDRGSHMKKTMRILYLPWWPHVNAEDRYIGLQGLIVLGLGGLTLASGLKGLRR